MGNFQNRAAFGDIYTIPTGNIDYLAKLVYQEQKQRQQQKLQQDRALDDEFAKNVAGVKSADIPEITSAYNDFKQAHINLQKKGQKATPQDQMNVMLKKAAAFQAINASKEDKERLKQYGTLVKSDNKGIYDPNAHNMISTWMNTPTSKRNLDEDANLKYRYAMPNIDSELKFATGNGKDVTIDIGVDPNDPLKNKKEIYKVINPPNTFYNNLFTGLASRSDNRGFIRTVNDSITDEEKDKLRTAYEAKIQNPKFKALYGEVQPFPASAANTELGEAVALKTMEAFVNLPIDKPTRTESGTNTEAVMDKRFKQQKIMEGIRQANRKELFGMREAAKEAGEEANDLWIDNYINKTKEEAKASGKTQTYKFANGTVVKGYPVEVDPVMSKALGFNEKNPGKLMVTEDGKFIPMFFKTNENYEPISKDGSFAIDPAKTNVLTQDAIKLALGGKTGVKQLNKEMTKPSSPTKKITVKKGELDDL